MYCDQFWIHSEYNMNTICLLFQYNFVATFSAIYKCLLRKLEELIHIWSKRPPGRLWRHNCDTVSKYTLTHTHTDTYYCYWIWWTYAAPVSSKMPDELAEPLPAKRTLTHIYTHTHTDRAHLVSCQLLALLRISSQATLRRPRCVCAIFVEEELAATCADSCDRLAATCLLPRTC